VTTGAAPGLAALRAAVLAADAGQARAEIERLRQQATLRADALAVTLVASPGTVSQAAVVHAFWLVPVCVVDLPPAAGVDGLARIAGVTAVHRCGEARPWW
jgi:hypothetical protein